MTDASDWTGPVGDSWASEWRRTDRSFAALAPHLDAAIFSAATNPVRIVDIGCGAGATAIAVADMHPQARIVGIDLSPALVAIARERAGHRTNIAFVTGDAVAEAAARARVDMPVDLYVSRHGVMFFADPVAAFASLGAAAAPGATFVFSCFAERPANRWAVETLTAVGTDATPNMAQAADTPPGPFAFADPGHAAAILAAAGWDADPPQRIEFAYRAGEGDDPVADAVAFFRRIGPAAARLRAMSLAEREAGIARLTDICERHRSGDVVEFPAAAWIWTARRPKGRYA